MKNVVEVKYKIGEKVYFLPRISTVDKYEYQTVMSGIIEKVEVNKKEDEDVCVIYALDTLVEEGGGSGTWLGEKTISLSPPLRGRKDYWVRLSRLFRRRKTIISSPPIPLNSTERLPMAPSYLVEFNDKIGGERIVNIANCKMCGDTGTEWRLNGGPYNFSTVPCRNCSGEGKGRDEKWRVVRLRALITPQSVVFESIVGDRVLLADGKVHTNLVCIPVMPKLK